MKKLNLPALIKHIRNVSSHLLMLFVLPFLIAMPQHALGQKKPQIKGVKYVASCCIVGETGSSDSPCYTISQIHMNPDISYTAALVLYSLEDAGILVETMDVQVIDPNGISLPVSNIDFFFSLFAPSTFWPSSQQDIVPNGLDGDIFFGTPSAQPISFPFYLEANSFRNISVEFGFSLGQQNPIPIGDYTILLQASGIDDSQVPFDISTSLSFSVQSNRFNCPNSSFGSWGGFRLGMSQAQSSPSKWYPNPSQGIGFFEMALKEDSEVTVSILDVQGKQVLTPISKRAFPAGDYRFKFDIGKLAQGLYYTQIHVGGEIQLIKWSKIE